MEEHFAALAAWIREHGGVAHVDVRADSAMDRGVVVTRDIEEGARLLAIPRSLLLTREIAAAADANVRLSAAGVSPSDGYLALVVYLLGARRERTPWRAYVNALPVSAPPLPLGYDDATLALLAGSSILPHVLADRALVREQHNALCASGPSLKECDFGEFLWARSMVSSRAFSLIGTRALVPMADMLNHARTPDVDWGYEHPTESFVMRPMRDIAAGEMVCDSYGQKSNRQLLEVYGFCLDDARYDDTLLCIPLPSGEEKTFRLRVDEVKEETEAVAYIQRMAGNDRAARLMIEACDEALTAFPTSIDFDDALLARRDLDGPAWNCVRVRAGEKRALRAFRERRSC